MSTSITISGLKANGGRILNGAKISGNGENVNIQLNDIELEGNTTILENLNIGEVMERLDYRMREMDRRSDEFIALREVVEANEKGGKQLLTSIAKHLGQFSEGVLASIVASYLV